MGVTGAALAGIRLAVTALLSIAFVSSASWRSGRGRSSRAARTLSGEFLFLVLTMRKTLAQSAVARSGTRTLLLRTFQRERIPVHHATRWPAVALALTQVAESGAADDDTMFRPTLRHPRLDARPCSLTSPFSVALPESSSMGADCCRSLLPIPVLLHHLWLAPVLFPLLHPLVAGAGGSRSGLGAEHRNRGDHGGPLPAATAAAAAAAGPTSRKS